MSARAPKAHWVVRGSVGGAMYLRSDRGIGGEPRWALRVKEARRFASPAEAQAATVWAGGRVEEVRP